MNFYLYDKDLQYIKTYCPDHLISEFTSNPNFNYKILMEPNNREALKGSLSVESENEEIEFQYNC